MSTMKYYMDVEGSYLLGTDGEAPTGAIEVPFPPDDARQKWNGEAWLPYVVIVPPQLSTGGLARFTGAAPSTVLEAIRMAGVTRISKGRYRVVHESPMPSDQYSVLPSIMDALPRTIRVTARTAAYVEIRVTDLDGVAQDPAEATVRTERVITS